MNIVVAKWNEKDGNTLTADGLIRINDNKPEFGSMMVMAQSREFSSGGFTNKRTKVAFITGTVEDLETMIKDDNLKEGTNFNRVYGEHKIVTVEKVESEVGEREGFSEKINPTTGEVLTKDGEVIMRRTHLVPVTSEMHDVLIDHDRVPAGDDAVAEFKTAGAGQKQTEGAGK